MILAYIDESADRYSYTMTSVMVNDSDANALAESLDEVVVKAASAHDGIWPDTELHAYDLAWGYDKWKDLRGNVDAVAEIYATVIDAIAAADIKITSRGVDLAGLRRRYGDSADPHAVTLTFALERIQNAAAAANTTALVIADEIGKKQPSYRRNFREYKKLGTWGYKPTVLANIVDTIHFAPSNSSRLIQAADMVAYTRFEKDRIDSNPRARKFYEEQWAKLQPRVSEDSQWDPDPVVVE